LAGTLALAKAGLCNFIDGDGDRRRTLLCILRARPALSPVQQQEQSMSSLSAIREHMEVIGADGAHVGTVDKVEGSRIKLTRDDSGEGHHKGHHHFIPGDLVADVEGNQVRLSANADVAVLHEEEADRKSAH
jgi:hypothetical protein